MGEETEGRSSFTRQFSDAHQSTGSPQLSSPSPERRGRVYTVHIHQSANDCCALRRSVSNSSSILLCVRTSLATPESRRRNRLTDVLLRCVTAILHPTHTHTHLQTHHTRTHSLSLFLSVFPLFLTCHVFFSGFPSLFLHRFPLEAAKAPPSSTGRRSRSSSENDDPPGTHTLTQTLTNTHLHTRTYTHIPRRSPDRLQTTGF